MLLFLLFTSEIMESLLLSPFLVLSFCHNSTKLPSIKILSSHLGFWINLVSLSCSFLLSSFFLPLLDTSKYFFFLLVTSIFTWVHSEKFRGVFYHLSLLTTQRHFRLPSFLHPFAVSWVSRLEFRVSSLKTWFLILEQFFPYFLFFKHPLTKIIYLSCNLYEIFNVKLSPSPWLARRKTHAPLTGSWVKIYNLDLEWNYNLNGSSIVRTFIRTCSNSNNTVHDVQCKKLEMDYFDCTRHT